MKKLIPFALVILVVAVVSCTKEYSEENSIDSGDLIVGTDCRISQVSYTDTATGVGLGSITATINGADIVTDITQFDSLGAQIISNSQPTVVNSDTIFINPDEYFVQDHTTKRIARLSGLVDPSDIFSPRFLEDYIYDANGYLIKKSYSYDAAPGVAIAEVNYTYSGGNLTHMAFNDIAGSQLVADADITYFSNIAPKNYLYIFPDEQNYAVYNQFYNFGKKPLNAVKTVSVRSYSGSVSDTTNTVFGSYMMSRDNYVLSTIMSGADLPSLPAQKGKLKFSYHCK